MSGACPVFSFAVHFVPADRDDAARRALAAAWQRLVEGRGLQSRGGMADAFDFVVTGEAMQASDADRLAVEHWLRERNDLLRWTVGELRDLQDE